MDRGPLALFGAIVAVGVGPALWLGVQLGELPGSSSPTRPPVVSEQGAEKTGQDLPGGTGAGQQADDSPATQPRGHVIPLTTSAKPSPSASSKPSASSTPEPSSASPSQTKPTTEAPTTPPTESTTAPTVEPTEPTDTSEPTEGPTATTEPTEDESGYVPVDR